MRTWHHFSAAKNAYAKRESPVNGCDHALGVVAVALSGGAPRTAAQEKPGRSSPAEVGTTPRTNW